MTDYIQVSREDVEYVKDHFSSGLKYQSNPFQHEIDKAVCDRLSAALSAEPVVSELKWDEDGRVLLFNKRPVGYLNIRKWEHSGPEATAVFMGQRLVIGRVPYADGVKALEARAWLSPVKQEPSTSRAEWEAAQEALAQLEAHSYYNGLGAQAGGLAVTVRKALNLLPAASEPPLKGTGQ